MNFVVAVKSGNAANFYSAYNFINAATKYIRMIFFYQNGIYILLNSVINKKWSHLLLQHNLLGLICQSSCTKRGINKNYIADPFKTSSIIEFINDCETADRIITF